MKDKFPCDNYRIETFKCPPDDKGFVDHTCGRAKPHTASDVLKRNAEGIEEFIVKDSGERKVFDSGMQRDTTFGKKDYSLALDGPMFERYAEHMHKGAQKYSKRNWMKAKGQEELDRFEESALRHYMQRLKGDVSEDHTAAIFFNLNGAEYVKDLMNKDEKLKVKEEFKKIIGEK